MMAAVTAAKNNSRILLLEAQEVLGRKLSVTGNGRCNISHDPITPGVYHSDMPKRVESVLSAFPFSETRAFFESIGVALYNRDGYVYPRSNEAHSVVRCLKLALEEAGVEVHCGEAVREASHRDKGFTVRTDSASYESRFLVVACGGMAKEEVGGCDFGLKIAESFSHRIAEAFPSLTELTCEGLSFKRLKGVRVHAGVAVIMDGEVISEDIGEIQLTESGVSGIAVFNISYEAIYALRIKKRVTVALDFFPEMDMDMLLAYMDYRCAIGRRSIEESLLGLLPEKLIPELLKTVSLNGKKAGRLTADEKLSLCKKLKALELAVTGHGDFKRAQVMAGGVLLHDLSDTLESDTVPGLYFIGENTNCDGICGGYNLQWAWSTGAVCGRAIAEAVGD